jgi:PAS domain S-box-containing protein
LDAVPDAMLVVDSQARIVLANAQAETLFRCERDQLLGKPIEILIPERFRTSHPGYLKDFFAEFRMRPMGTGLELYALRFDGEEFPAEISLNPLATQAGPLAIGVVRDIGERQQAERALDEHTARLRAQAQLLDLAHDAIYVRDKCGVITYWNREAEQTYGWFRNEALGKISHKLLRTVFPRPLTEIETEVFYKGQWEGELLQVTRTGRQMVVAGRWAVQTGDAGEPAAILEINRDISESKHTEERIKSLNLELHTRVLELAASNQELESFSYSVSHDLRAPLRQVDGFTKILLDHKSAGLDDDARECLLQIRQGTLRMARLVDDLLNFSRLGRQELRRQTVDLGLLVSDVVNEFQQQTRDRDIRWTVDTLSSVECDPQLMKQVFVNLVSNAVKFTQSRQPAVIEIGHDHKGKETVFWIKDNGVGFDMKYADKLFGVFQRLHLQEEFEGTGVGLANVHRIIHKHGGRIWANASLGAGATFSFTVGAAPAGGRRRERVCS